MSLTEAFNILQALGAERAVNRWGPEAMQSPAAIHACSITLVGLMLEPSEDERETAAIIAQIIWLVAVAFEAGRIYEGGIPE